MKKPDIHDYMLKHNGMIEYYKAKDYYTQYLEEELECVKAELKYELTKTDRDI